MKKKPSKLKPSKLRRDSVNSNVQIVSNHTGNSLRDVLNAMKKWEEENEKAKRIDKRVSIYDNDNFDWRFNIVWFFQAISSATNYSQASIY